MLGLLPLRQANGFAFELLNTRNKGENAIETLSFAFHKSTLLADLQLSLFRKES